MIPPSGSRSRSLTHWKRYPAFFASLAVAVTVWLAVISEETIERTLTVAIVLYPDRPDLMWTGDPPGDAVVRLQGKARTLWWMSWFTPPEVRIPLSALPASGIVRLRKEMVELPQRSDVQILALLRPDTFLVHVEQLVTRVVPISPRLRVTPRPGFTMVESSRAYPTVVEISGVASRMFAIDSVPTAEYSVTDVSSSGSLFARLAVIPDSNA